MTKPVAAPEIFQIPLDQIDPAIAPPGTKPGTPEFEEAVIMHYVLRYAEKGWQAMVTVDDGFVRVLAIPQQGMDPKDYVQGLLRNGFLEDALPILQALDGMVEDADIKAAAEQTQADFIFTVMEAWGLPRDKMPRYQEIYDKYGSVAASPYKIDTASFVVETRYGVWGAQAPLKPKGYSKKKRTFGPVELQFMNGVEGRFVGLLPESEKQNLH